MRIRLTLAFTILVFVSLALCFFVNGAQKKATYSRPEMLAFWEENMKPILYDRLTVGKYYVSEVQDRHDVLLQEVDEKYGKPQVNLVTSYHPKSNHIYLATDTRQGRAIIEIFLPSQMDIWNDLKMSGQANWRDRFQNFLIVAFMRGMERLVADPLLPKGSEDDPQSLIAKEKLAWAQTIKFTVAPMLEKHSMPLWSSDQEYYNAWVSCGMNVNSPKWDAFILDAYGHLYDR